MGGGQQRFFRKTEVPVSTRSSVDETYDTFKKLICVLLEHGHGGVYNYGLTWFWEMGRTVIEIESKRAVVPGPAD